ncbi:ATP-binding protein [Sporomusa carbonis]|uniref:ATP-binding protein n=1 Tax=Sporomusa carbonis TaxID=3076075 RepID=UPI003C7AF8B3
MNSKFVIKQSTISALMLGIFFFIAILLGSSIIYMNSSIKDERIAEQRRTEFKQLGINLATASDYLTDEARKYAVTKDAVHMNKYWEEINITQTRDKVISRLGELNSPSEEMALLAEAKRNSDALVNTERHSMRLVLEAQNVPEQDMPPEVASFHLSSEDQQLSADEKLAKARNIMFDAKYDADKRSIMGPIAQFQTIMNDRLEAELEVAREATTKAAILQTVLAVIIICAIAVLIRILFTQVTSPINHYTELLKVFSFRNEKFSLVPEGSLELRLLAQTFNELSNSFQEELVKRKQAEETMKAAKDEAEMANNAKSEFLAHMSHEIRTPLNTIIGYHYLLENTALTAKQAEYTQNLGMAAKNLLGIINEILDFSKIEARKMVLEAVDFDLHDMIKDLCSIMQVEARRKNLDFGFEIKPDVPRYLKGDTTRLKQVLLNLLSNGVKFTHRGRLHILVELLERKGRQVVLRFHVADTGIGIPEEQIPQLFEVFTQGDASTSRKYGGTGLGLAICKKIVELMQGEIHVQSTVGKGSTFSFTAKLERADSVPIVQKENEAIRLKAIFARKKVLLVEDNSINLKMTKEILTHLGFDTDIAGSGFKAVQMAGQKEYDAILMDIRMPEMDGYEATRRIKALKGEKTPPVIALSADAVEGVAEKAGEAGMSGYLTKPLNPVKLIDVLKKYVYIEDTAAAVAETYAADPDKQVDFDFESGIHRIGGKMDVYRDILKQFMSNHSEDAVKLERLIAAEKFEEARQLVHTVKGIAANIGANSLKQASMELGKALRYPDRPALNGKLRRFAIVISESCDALGKFIETISEKTPAQERFVDDANVEDLLARLLGLLDDGDSEAKHLFESLKQYFENVLTEEEYHWLHEKICTYSFDEASQELRRIIQKQGCHIILCKNEDAQE